MTMVLYNTSPCPLGHRRSGTKRLIFAVGEGRGEMLVPIDKLKYKDRFERTHEEHRRIYAAIEARDPAAARQAVDLHLQTSLQAFLRIVNTTDAD
jgi:hypothetical protein